MPYFTRKTVKTLSPSVVVRVTDTDNAEIELSHYSGGAIERLRRDTFLRDYREVADDDFNALFKWKEIYVSTEDGEPVKAWSDGQLWNGFECPHFELETVDRSTFKTNTSGSAVLFIPELDTIITVQGMGHEDEFILNDVLRMVAAKVHDNLSSAEDVLEALGESLYAGDDTEAFDNGTFDLRTIKGELIHTPIGPRRVYPFGDWTWSLIETSNPDEQAEFQPRL